MSRHSREMTPRINYTGQSGLLICSTGYILEWFSQINATEA